MTIYDKLFALAKAMAKDLQKGRKPKALKTSGLFSEETKQHIVQQLSEEEIEENLELLNKIDKEEGWEQIRQQMVSREQSKPHKKPRISSFYKVAAVVILFISMAYITYYKQTKVTDLDAMKTVIVTGTDKAILTLEDGTDVALEKEKPYRTETLSSNGERLEYGQNKTDSRLAYNYLTVPRGGQYQIIMSDSTAVWLNADTKIKYPIAFKKGEPRMVELLYGEAYFDVSPSTKHQGDAFKVIAQGQTVDVIGTEFNIKAYGDEQHIYTTLIEGKVNVTAFGKQEYLSPSEQSIFDLYTNQMTKSEVNVDYDVAWVRGYFNFRDRPLKDIMKVLSRWYDVEITFASPELETVTFSGLLNRKQNLDDILNGIQTTKFINAYEIKHKTITIK